MERYYTYKYLFEMGQFALVGIVVVGCAVWIAFCVIRDLLRGSKNS